MSSVDAQPLIASFSLGIVVVAGSAAIYFFTRGNGPSSLRAASRLVLVAFLCFSALWALVDFIASLIREDSNLPCHVAIGFASTFDQLARVLLQQSLLWLSFGDLKKSPWLYALQLALFLRLILGGVFVGVQRPQFKPVCVTSTGILPLGIAVLAVDMILIFSFLIRSMRTSVRVDAIKSKADTDRSRSMLLSLAGFSFWTALSSPMILGIMSIELVLRTTLPAVGLTILIVLVTVFKTSLTGPQAEISKAWPQDPVSRDYDMASVSEPNQQAPSRYSSYRPPSRYAEVKAVSRTTIVAANAPNAPTQSTNYTQANGTVETTITAQRNAHPEVSIPSQTSKVLPTISQPDPGQSNIGVGGVAVHGQLFPPPKVDITAPSIQDGDYKERFWSKFAKKNGNLRVNLAISNPIMNPSDNQNPLNRIATIDLKTAASQDRQRREEQVQPAELRLVATRRAPQPPTMTPEQMVMRSTSVQGRKQVGSSSGPGVRASNLEPILESGQASSSSAQLSPGVEEIRRRSPRRSTLLPAELPGSPVTRLGESSVQNTLDARVAEKTDAWDLLAIPKNDPELVESKVELAAQPASPAAKRISVAPAAARRRASSRRSSSSSISSKKSKTATAIFMDPNPPPPIPQGCVEASNEQQISGSEPPPPYKAAESTTASPSHATKPLPPPPPPIPSSKVPNGSPRLLIFPPNNQTKMVASRAMKGPGSVTSPAPTSTMANGRPRIPLPANPKPAARSKSVKKHEEQAPTIMFLDKIEYDDPWNIEDLVGEHTAMERSVSIKSTRTVNGVSVLSRPRPIPRKPEESRRFNTYSRMLNPQPHRRSLSCGSVNSKKSILHFEPASPTNLPPLPPLPLIDSKPLRSQLDHVKSMTLGEKIELFFPPASPSGSSIAASRRRSRSLPDISVAAEEHRISRILQGDDTAVEEAEPRADEFTKISIRTQGLLQLSEALKARNSPDPGIRTPRDEVTQMYMQSPIEHVESYHHDDAYKTSLLSPPPLSLGGRLTSPAKESDMLAHDMGEEAASHWGSVHSPVAAINIQKAKEVDVPRLQPVLVDDIDDRHKSVQPPTFTANSDESQDLKFIIEDALVPAYVEPAYVEPKGPGDSPLSDYGPHQAFWHRRVGDECPTFSARIGRARPRKVTPPPPLVLNRPPKPPVLVEAEPSPLESPQHALDVIEEQLRNLDSPNQDSQVNERQRMTLLEDLEMEMGVQESRWQTMRHTYIRDSLSTVDTSPVEDSRNSSTSPKPGHASLASILAERRESRRLSRRSRDSADLQIAAVIGLDETPANRWSDTLADAEYRNSRSQFLTSTGSRISFLAVSHQASQVGSPTPPDTDESEGEIEDGAGAIEVPFILSEPVDNGPASPPAQPIQRPLSTEPQIEPREQQKALQNKIESVSPGTPKARILRLEHTMSTRRDSRLLPPDAKRLQTQSPEAPEETPQVSPKPLPKPLPKTLAKPPSPKESTVESLPLPDAPALAPKSKSFAQRPMRRTKRMTALPDILESPLPISDKTNTLGIFKFPGGQATDTAAFPMRQPFPGARAPMPGTMSSGTSMMVPKVTTTPGVPTLGAYLPGFGPPGCASSFFDDQDEEDAGDNFDDFDEQYNVDDEEDDDDDDFDETTLWEIASLLKSDRVPSRASLFPGEWAGKQEGKPQPAESLSSPPPTSTSIPMMLDIGTPAVPQKSQSLWENKTLLLQAPPKSHGLLQPSTQAWKAYTAAPSTSARAPKRPAMAAASISSTSLWQRQEAEAASFPAGLLWYSKKQTRSSRSTPRLAITTSPKQASNSVPTLWATKTTSDVGSPQEALWSSQRKLQEVNRSAEVSHADVRRKPSQKSKAPLPELRSSNLWANKQDASARSPDWLRRTHSRRTGASIAVNSSGLWAPKARVPENRAPWLSKGLDAPFVNLSSTATSTPRKKPTLPSTLPQLTSSSLWSVDQAAAASSAPRPDWAAITAMIAMAEQMAPSSSPIQAAPRQETSRKTAARSKSDWDTALQEAIVAGQPQKVYISTADASLWSAESPTVPSNTSASQMWKPQRVSTASRTSWAPKLPPVQRQKRVSTVEHRSSIAPNITGQSTWSKEHAETKPPAKSMRDWLGAY